MIFDITYNNQDASEMANDILGKPYSFFKSLKLGGVGSKRMIIKKVSPNLSVLNNDFGDLKYCNVELRANGILVFVTVGQKRFFWIIPYRKLTIYKTDNFSIHADGKFISLANTKTYKENKSFFNKLAEQKIKCLKQYSFQP